MQRLNYKTKIVTKKQLWPKVEIDNKWQWYYKIISQLWDKSKLWDVVNFKMKSQNYDKNLNNEISHFYDKAKL